MFAILLFHIFILMTIIINVQPTFAGSPLLKNYNYQTRLREQTADLSFAVADNRSCGVLYALYQNFIQNQGFYI